MNNDSNLKEAKEDLLIDESIIYSISRPKDLPETFIISEKILKISIKHLYTAGNGNDKG